MKLAAVFKMSLGALVLLSASSVFAMARGPQVLVASVSTQKTTTYIFMMEPDGGCNGIGGECDEPGAIQSIGPSCRETSERFSPSLTDVENGIKTNLKALGYSDEDLSNLMFNKFQRGKVSFGGNYPDCSNSIDNYTIEAYLPSVLIRK